MIGNYRALVTVQQPNESRDLHGDPVKNWITYCVRRARIEPISGREFWDAQQIRAEANVRIYLRYDSVTTLITEKMRILWGTRAYDITQPPIDKDEKHRELIIVCTERR